MKLTPVAQYCWANAICGVPCCPTVRNVCLSVPLAAESCANNGLNVSFSYIRTIRCDPKKLFFIGRTKHKIRDSSVGYCWYIKPTIPQRFHKLPTMGQLYVLLEYTIPKNNFKLNLAFSFKKIEGESLCKCDLIALFLSILINFGFLIYK